MRSSEIQHIGFWGLSGAGKTTYVCAFLHEVNRRRLTEPEFEWHVSESEQSLYEFRQRNCQPLLEGTFPQSTDSSTPIQVDINVHHPQEGQFSIRFMDVAGELALDQAAEEKFGYFSMLRRASGIFIFIDPLMEYDQIKRCRLGIQKLSDELRRSETRQGTRIAFCLTQIDRDAAWDNYKIKNIPEVFVEEHILGKVIFQEIIGLCPNYHCFSISSIGRLKPNGVSEKSNVTYDGKLASPMKWEPYQILEPFFWIVKRKK